VLVHYRDLRSALPEQLQWEDRLWLFEREGDALRLREYPLVAFDDESGRFERRGGESQRVLGAFEPSAGQRREIAAGLGVGTREVREKRLRPTATGWASSPGRFDSARFVGFESSVELDLSGAAPRLVVSDSLGSSAAAGALEGRTEYRGERVAADGSVEGAFDRDGRRVGRFRMLRAGRPQGVPASAEPPREATRAEVEERLYRTLGRQLAHAEALPERFAGGPAERAALRARVREEVERLFEAQGNDARAHAPTLEKLAAAIERAYAEARLSREEIGRGVEEGRIRP
jgi:hypothetical protein